MSGGFLGGGVIFVVAALLWIAVLVPAWVRRREFKASERNALRLQRTLRVLAETTEVPYEVRVEATAKEALAHEKLLRTAQKRQEADRAAELAEARAEQVRAEIRAQQMRRKQAAAQRSARLRRPIVRRVRAFAALAALMGLVGALVGAGLAVAGSGAVLLAWSSAIFCAALAGLVLLAPGRARVEPIPAEQVEAPPVEVVDAEQPSDDLAATGESEAAAAAHAAAQQAAAARIQRARALARARAERMSPASARENQPDSMLLQEARRQVAEERSAPAGAHQRSMQTMQTPAMSADSAHGAGVVVPVDAAAGRSVDPFAPAPRTASTADAASAQIPLSTRRQRSAQHQQRSAAEAARIAEAARLGQMGRVGDTSTGMPDLDAVLRRRRNAG